MDTELRNSPVLLIRIVPVGTSYCVAFLVGWMMERRFVGFSTDIPAPQKLTRAVVGLLGYYLISLILSPLIKTWLPGFAGTTISCFIQMFYVAFLFPLCAKAMERKRINGHDGDGGHEGRI